MTNIANVLKAEITRLARKELKSETASLAKASAQYRRDIAALKREFAALEKSVRRLSKESKRAVVSQDEGEAGGARRFRAGGFAAHRKRLGLSAEEFGKLIGVSAQSIYKWESGKTRPRASQLEAIAAVRKLGKREAAAKLAE